MAIWWKLKREIKRLGLQVSELRPFIQGPINRIYYDRFKRSEIVLTEGQQPASANSAIILLYQPDGLLASTYDQLDHFLKNNISPIVISNAPLSEADRETLKTKCMFLMERPNFGYDFGGYRDGVLEFLSRGIIAENLFLLNDSIWFPIRTNCDFLDKAISAKPDIFGIFYTKKSKKKSHWHLHSYFYRFNTKTLTSSIFKKYWQRMPLYNGSKRIVIRQFETKLTAYFVSKGFSASGQFGAADVRRAMHELNDIQLDSLVKYHLTADQLAKSVFSPLEGVKMTDDTWREKITAMIDHNKTGNYFLNAHPRVLLEKLVSPILKKNRDYKFVRQREEILAEQLHETLLPNVRQEVAIWDQDRKLTLDTI